MPKKFPITCPRCRKCGVEKWDRSRDHIDYDLFVYDSTLLTDALLKMFEYGDDYILYKN